MIGSCWPGVWKISLTCANSHLSSIFPGYIWQTSQFSKIFKFFLGVSQQNSHWSVKSSNYFGEQVRQIFTGQWNLLNIVESRSRKTFPQIKLRIINLPAELGWISEILPLSPQLRLLGLEGRFSLTHPHSAGRFISYSVFFKTWIKYQNPTVLSGGICYEWQRKEALYSFCASFVPVVAIVILDFY